MHRDYHMSKRRTSAPVTGADVVDLPETWERAVTARADTVVDSAISKRAYELWLERGCPEGSPEQDWYQAKSEFEEQGPEVLSQAGVK